MNEIKYIVYTENSIGSLEYKDACRYMRDNYKTEDFAVVDLNRINHLLKIKEENPKIKGVEILSKTPGISMIALGIDENNYEDIEKYIDEKENNIDIDKVIKNLNSKFNIELDKREILLYSNKEYLNRLDIARLLYKKGYVTTTREALTKYVDLCTNSIEIDETITELKEMNNFLNKKSKKIFCKIYNTNIINEKLKDTIEECITECIDIPCVENHQI